MIFKESVVKDHPEKTVVTKRRYKLIYNVQGQMINV